jgi:hypothetical protein
VLQVWSAVVRGLHRYTAAASHTVLDASRDPFMQALHWTRRRRRMKFATTCAACRTMPASSCGTAATSGKAVSQFLILLSFASSQKRMHLVLCGQLRPAQAGRVASTLSLACPTAAPSKATPSKARAQLLHLLP